MKPLPPPMTLLMDYALSLGIAICAQLPPMIGAVMLYHRFLGPVPTAAAWMWGAAQATVTYGWVLWITIRDYLPDRSDTAPDAVAEGEPR